MVSRGEAYARIQAACGARAEGIDTFVLALTDSLVLGWDEAMTGAKEFARIGVDAVFVQAFTDAASMSKRLAFRHLPTSLKAA